jgi:hypothetical protein
MQAERDQLKNVVFPAMNEDLQQRIMKRKVENCLKGVGCFWLIGKICTDNR